MSGSCADDLAYCAGSFEDEAPRSGGRDFGPFTRMVIAEDKKAWTRARRDHYAYVYSHEADAAVLSKLTESEYWAGPWLAKRSHDSSTYDKLNRERVFRSDSWVFGLPWGCAEMP